MVLPLLAASGRVVAGSAKATGRSATKSVQSTTRPDILTPANNPRLSAIAINRTMRQQANKHGGAMNPAELKESQQQAVNSNRPPEPHKGMGDRIHKAFKTGKAGIASVEILSFYIWFYAAQVLFAILFMGVYYIDQEWWFASYVIPSETLMGLSWIAIILIGTLFMIKAPMVYMATLTKLSKSSIIIVYIICFAGYLTPFFFILPWVAIWALVVTFSQD